LLVCRVGIDDCEVQTFRAGGKGGQNQNKRDTGVRVIHHPSGARGESREARTQLSNKRIAFRRMAESAVFKWWAHMMAYDVDRRVDEAMHPANLTVEYGVV
jgi:protein subunit release factor B